MKVCLLKKLCFLSFVGMSFVAFADELVVDDSTLDQVVVTDQVDTNNVATTQVGSDDQGAALQASSDAPVDLNSASGDAALSSQGDVSQAALIELQCLYHLLSTKKFKEGTPSKAGKRIIRAAGAATITTLIAGLMKLAKKDSFTDVGTIGWLLRGLVFGGICVGSYEGLGKTLPENAAIYRAVLSSILTHWNLYQMLIPEEYVPVIETLYEAFVANSHQLPLSESEAKKFVRTMKYDVKRKMVITRIAQ